MKRRQFLEAAGALAAAGLGGMARAAGPAPYGLAAGKPYAGTHLKLLLPPASQFRAQQKRLDQFEALTGIKTTYSYVPYGQLLDKITTEAVGGSSEYDLFSFQDSWMASLVGYLNPLDASIAADKLDMGRYPEVFREACIVGGKTYGLPIRAHPQLLFYRKDLLGEVGAKVPASWSDMVATAGAIQNKSGISGVALDYVKGSGFQNLWLWFNCLWGHGSDLFDAAGQPRFNDAAGVAGTQAYVDVLLKDKVANPGSSQFNEYDMVNSMAQGKSAMIMVWWWTYSVLTGDRSRLKPEQVGFAPMVRFNGGKSPTLATLMPFGISKQSRHKAAAWEYLKWVSNPDLEVEIVCDKSDPQTSDIVATQTATYLNDKVNAVNHGLHRVALESLKGARILPKLTIWPEVASVLETTISEIVAVGKPVKPSLDDAAAQVARIARRSGRHRS
ncbi:ABC transporter substrate-binding protein [Candidimonas nitroreducens]|uniref:ABC transporter substrate-binding protein n=1 Tax=Candidimonas nitroreducens TaxID=683354 RepID=UPI001E2EAA17|nr:sugar ABC transporter substrate-binding protein [Candidimonas nitroreducens]